MAKSLVNTKAKFGTLPVFLTALSTILGAILFLRFGRAFEYKPMIGFNTEALKDIEESCQGYSDPGNILFVSSNRAKAIN